MERLSITTRTREEMRNITAILREAVTRHQWQDGVLVVSVPTRPAG